MKSKDEFLRDIMGSIENRVRSAYNEGKRAGVAEVRDAITSNTFRAIDHLVQIGWLKDHDKIISEAEYKRGLEDAWNLVVVIEGLPEAGGLSNREIAEVFGRYYHSYELYSAFTAKEALELMRRWKEKKKTEPQEQNCKTCKHDDGHAVVRDGQEPCYSCLKTQHSYFPKWEAKTDG